MLLRQRQWSVLPQRELKSGVLGGRLRKAWDRKRALGEFDRSLSGTLALMIGMPPRTVLRAARAIRRIVRPAPTAEAFVPQASGYRNVVGVAPSRVRSGSR